jgi:hypothetical protein
MRFFEKQVAYDFVRTHGTSGVFRGNFTYFAGTVVRPPPTVYISTSYKPCIIGATRFLFVFSSSESVIRDFYTTLDIVFSRGTVDEVL